jgi:hypothetical protein
MALSAMRLKRQLGTDADAELRMQPMQANLNSLIGLLPGQRFGI